MKYILSLLLLFPILGQAAAREAWSAEPGSKSAASVTTVPVPTDVQEALDNHQKQFEALATFLTQTQEKGRQLAAAIQIIFGLEEELKESSASHGAAGDPEEDPLREAKAMLTNFALFNFEAFNEHIEGIRESLTSGGAKK